MTAPMTRYWTEHAVPLHKPRAAAPLTHHPRQRQRLLVEYPRIQVQKDYLIFLKRERKLDQILLDPDTSRQLHVQLKIQLSPPIPFEQCLLCTPDQRQEFLLYPPPQPPLLQEKGVILIKKIHLTLIQKLLGHPRD